MINAIKKFFADREKKKKSKKAICIQCKHCSEPDGIKDYYCHHPKRCHKWTDYITGEESSGYDYCMYYNTMGDCEFFKSKDKVQK